MRRSTGRIATTHVDRHGERFAKEALQEAASLRGHFIVPVLVEHDRRRPPAGRGIGAAVELMSDGNYALVSEFEIFEPGDDPAAYADHGKPVLTPHLALQNAELLVSGAALEASVWEDVSEIANLLPMDEPPQREGKKGEVVTGSVVIALALFVAAQISSGFLKKIGEDGYSRLKEKLVKLFSRPSMVDVELEVVFVVLDGSQRCEIRVCFDAPAKSVAADALIHASKSVDADVSTRGIAKNGIVQLTYRYSQDGLEFLYGVLGSGVPFPFDRVQFVDPAVTGLSVTFKTQEGLPTPARRI